MINIDNYEAYLLDLWEGNISLQDKDALYAFLKLHPELEADLPDMMPELTDKEVVDFNKETLKYAKITPENRDYFFIAYFENELTNKERRQVDEFLKANTHFVKEFNQFKKAQLQAPSILFEDKKSLLPKNSTSIRKWTLRIAAALLFLIGGQFLVVLFQNDGLPLEEEKAETLTSGMLAEKKKFQYNLELLDLFSVEQIKENKNHTQPVIAQNKQEKKFTDQNHLVEKKEIMQKMIMMDKIDAEEILLTAHYDKNPVGVPIEKQEYFEESNPSDLNEITALSPKDFLLGWTKNKLKRNNTKDNKEDLNDYDQTLMALGINRSLDFITQEKQQIAIKDNKTKKTHFKWGKFSFERVTSID